MFRCKLLSAMVAREIASAAHTDALLMADTKRQKSTAQAVKAATHEVMRLEVGK